MTGFKFAFLIQIIVFAVVVSSVGSGMQSPSTEDKCRSHHSEPSWGERAKDALHLAHD